MAQVDQVVDAQVKEIVGGGAQANITAELPDNSPCWKSNRKFRLSAATPERLCSCGFQEFLGPTNCYLDQLITDKRQIVSLENASRFSD